MSDPATPDDNGNWPPPEWGLSPSDWLPQAPEEAAPTDAPVLQPGLGIPASTVDNAVAAYPMAPPEADAVTGAGAPDASTPTDITHITGSPTIEPTMPRAPSDPLANPDATSTPFDSLNQSLGVTPLGPTGTAEEEATKRAASETDEQYAARVAMFEAKRQHDTAAAALEASRKDSETQAKLYHDQQQAMIAARQTRDKIDADAAVLANTKIDPDNRSTFSVIRGVLAAFIGGLAAPSMGGRNVGLEAVQREIDRGVDAQKADLANKWKAIDTRKAGAAEQMARIHEDYINASTQEVAAYDRVKADLMTQAQDYDPRGATALKIEGAIRDTEARKAAAQLKQNEVLTKQQIELRDAARKEAELKETQKANEERVRANKASEKIASIHAWNETRAQNNADKMAPENLAKARADVAKTNAEIDNLKLAGKTAEAAKLQTYGLPGVAAPQLGPDGKPVLDADGKPVLTDATFTATSATPEEMQKLRTRVGSTKEIVSILDEIRTKRHGWSTDVGNSVEHQQLKTLSESLNVAIKNAAELGAISKSDADLIAGMKGFDDVTGRKSIEGGVLQARKNFIRTLSADLKAHGYQGDYDIPDLLGDKNVAEPEDESVKALLRDPGHGDTSINTSDENAELEKSFTPEERAKYIDAKGGYLSPTDTEAQQAAMAHSGGVYPAQWRTLTTLRDAATSDADPESRTRALSNLAMIQREAEQPNVKVWAERFLAQAAQQNMRGGSTDEPDVTRETSTASERPNPAPKPKSGKK